VEGDGKVSIGGTSFIGLCVTDSGPTELLRRESCLYINSEDSSSTSCFVLPSYAHIMCTAVWKAVPSV
jgi:hypothetical protein